MILLEINENGECASSPLALPRAREDPATPRLLVCRPRRHLTFLSDNLIELPGSGRRGCQVHYVSRVALRCKVTSVQSLCLTFRVYACSCAQDCAGQQFAGMLLASPEVYQWTVSIVFEQHKVSSPHS